MKKKFLSIVFIFNILYNVNAQKLDLRDVPPAVKAKFTILYPRETKVKWGKEKNNYEAEFEFKEAELSVLIDPQGNLIQTETKLKIDKLPKKVLDYISINKDGEKIKEAAKVIDTAGVKSFEVELKDTDLFFDHKGEFIKEERN